MDKIDELFFFVRAIRNLKRRQISERERKCNKKDKITYALKTILFWEGFFFAQIWCLSKKDY